MAIGIPYLLAAFDVPNATTYLFVALGAAFAIAYVTGFSPYVYLVPAGTLMGFGVGLLIPSWFSLPGETAAPIFLASLAIGFVAVFAIRPQRRWPLIPAAAVGIVAIAAALRIAALPPSIEPLFVPLVLILIGGWLILAPRT
jgi:hypothetical protein